MRTKCLVLYIICKFIAFAVYVLTLHQEKRKLLRKKEDRDLCNIMLVSIATYSYDDSFVPSTSRYTRKRSRHVYTGENKSRHFDTGPCHTDSREPKIRELAC